MNYDNNIGPIGSFGNDTPALFADLQSKLSTRTEDNTPILMMPLHLENRYMKVMRNMMDDVIKMSTKDAHADLQTLSEKANEYAVFPSFNSQSALAAAEFIQYEVNQALSSVENVSSENFLGKEALAKRVATTEQEVNQALSHFIESCTDVDILSQVEIINGQTQTSLSSISEHLDTIEGDSSWETEMGSEAVAAISAIGLHISSIDSITQGLAEEVL